MARQIITAEGNAHNPVQPPFAIEADGEAYRCWGVLCSTPGFFYRGEWVDFSVEDAQACVDHHTTLKQETGYEPPIIVQHDPKHRDGANLGYAESLHLKEGEDGNTYLLAVLRWSDPGVEEKIDREEIRYLSPHIGHYQDDANRQADFVVLEVSVCSSPYQKRLGRKHLLSENEGGKEMEEVLAKIAELEAKQAQHEADLTATVHALEALEARLPGADTESEGEPEEAVEAEEEGTEGDPEPEDEDAAEPLTNAHMAEVLGGVASGLGLSEEQTQLVADAARGDVQLAARLLTTFATQPATAKSTARTSGLKGRVSVPSSTSPAAKVDKQSVYNACLSECGGDAKKAADLYFARTKNQ